MISEASGWVSIRDRLPAEGVEVLLFVSPEGLIVIGSLETSEGERYWESDSDEVAASPLSAVSHWMPLPPAPLL
jgi:hypothetical protein